jgi:hypothetical protein
METKEAHPRQYFGHAVQFCVNCWPNQGDENVRQFFSVPAIW